MRSFPFIFISLDIPTPIPYIPTLILLIPNPIPCIPTLIPHIICIPNIPTPIPCIPILIPRIPFPDSPFRLLQIALIFAFTVFFVDSLHTSKIDFTVFNVSHKSLQNAQRINCR